MDFPLFHLDGSGNRLLIAVIAVTHVLINHAFAVGAMPMIAWLERKGMRSGDARWDALAYRILFVCFILTTTVGAMTGVGIWFSASLVNPYSIGSLLRIFFFGWFAEWIVFVIEVVLILAYFLTWKTWTGERKKAHNRLGWTLGIFSWITMALIVAVLAFMMSTGNWLQKPSFWTAFLNPVYFPQLAFRTPLALAGAGLLGLFLAGLFFRKDLDFRDRAFRELARWTLYAIPLVALGAWWYWSSVPAAMKGNLSVALATMQFTNWHGGLLRMAMVSVAVVVAVCLVFRFFPRRVPAWIAVFPFLLTLVLLGYFERVREFIRKPFVIPGYMYSNMYRLEDYPLLRRDGVLRHAAFVKVRNITPENEVEAGRDVFLLTCTRCHTTDGMNGVVAKFDKLLGPGAWDPTVIANYVGSMHGARPFMPPFPGSDEELRALSRYLAQLRENPEVPLGAQSAGVRLPPPAINPSEKRP